MTYRRDLCVEYENDPTPFGRLRPIQWLRREQNETIWLFRCTCGTLTEVSMNKVKPGCTQSCGCLKREKSTSRILPHAGWNRLPLAQAAQNHIYRKYQTRAQRLGLAFEMSYAQFCYLMSQPCYIPGCEAINSNAWRSPYSGELFYYNGIDRIDSGLGYVDGNVAPCCKRCNAAKNDMSLNEFFNWIDRIKGVR